MQPVAQPEPDPGPILVLRGGRVMDPASGRDGIFDVAIRDGRIVEISETPLSSIASCAARRIEVSWAQSQE